MCVYPCTRDNALCVFVYKTKCIVCVCLYTRENALCVSVCVQEKMHCVCLSLCTRENALWESELQYFS